MTALRPATSPPPVRMPMRFLAKPTSQHWHVAITPASRVLYSAASGLRSARIAADEVRLGERGDDFFWRRENPLVPDDRDRIILAGVFACDRVKTLRRNSDSNLAVCLRNDAVNAKALVVAEQCGNVVAVRGRVEFD